MCNTSETLYLYHSHDTILYYNTVKLLNYILQLGLKVNLSVIICVNESLIVSILLKISCKKQPTSQTFIRLLVISTGRLVYACLIMKC